MPHITAEYSANLADRVSIRDLVDALHQTIVRSGLFDVPAIRSRALPREIYRIADGNPENTFLHVIARIRTGRSVEQRKELGGALLAAARKVLAGDPRPIALGVEIHEIDPEMLFRHITIK
jgi:5-carboxymethyl-2-hydroxymuconate isomerase